MSDQSPNAWAEQEQRRRKRYADALARIGQPKYEGYCYTCRCTPCQCDRMFDEAMDNQYGGNQ